MSMQPTPTSVNALVEKIKALLLQPRAEWDRIAVEPADLRKLYLGYLLPIALAVALFVFVGVMLLSGFYFIGPIMYVITLVVTALVAPFVLALITNALAPSFGSTPDIGQAHKLAVYASTPAVLAQAFAVHYALSVFALIGLYSFALFYIGLPRLMKTPDDKRIVYFAAIAGIALIAAMIYSALMQMQMGWGARFYR